MRAPDYAHAIVSLIREGTSIDKAFSELGRMLTKRGHTRLYPTILKHMMRLIEKESEENTARVILAREDSKQQFLDAVADALTEVGAKDTTYVVDPSIVGGFIVETKDTRIDHSYKKKLLTIYRSLTT